MHSDDSTTQQRRRNRRTGWIVGALALGLYLGFFAYRYAMLAHVA